MNPNTALFSTLSVDTQTGMSPVFWAVTGVLRFLKAQCRDWLKGLVDLLVYRTVSSSWKSQGITQLLTQVEIQARHSQISQEYGGRDSDITIYPWRNHLSLFSSWYAFLKVRVRISLWLFDFHYQNPSPEEYQMILQVSKRNTWPYLSRAKAHCNVEVALDK